MELDAVSSLLLPAVILIYIYWRLVNHRFFKLASSIPGPRGYPFIGNALELRGSANEIFTAVYTKSHEYEDVLRLWLGPRLLVFLTNPADIELILSSHVHIDKSPEYRFFEPWLGNGLLISTGDKWRGDRKVIAPTFHLNILKSFIPLFNRNSKATVEKMNKEQGNFFDCHDYMSEATVEMLLETAMGVNKNTQESGYEYAMAVMKMCDILHLRSTKIWLRPDILFNITRYKKIQEKLLNTIHTLTKKVFKIRKEDYIKNGCKLVGRQDLQEEGDEKDLEKQAKKTEGKGDLEKQAKKEEEKGDFSFGHSKGLKDDLDDDIGEKKRLAFLDYLLDSAQGGILMSDEDVKNQVDTIMFEGHDTTAAASSFFLCLMAAHPHIQDKVEEELIKIFGDSDRRVNFEDTTEMKYLERCIMETLRMYPPVPVIAREIQTEVKLASKNLTIPAKSTVIIGTYKLHRRPDIYPKPDIFDPDNFLPERSANRHYYSYIPFSAGPRSCVGRKYAMLKLKILLSTILRNYRVVDGPKEDLWKLQADIILKRTNGFKVKIKTRKLRATV